MKKVVLASLLACVPLASGLPSAYAQQPVALGTQAQAGANQPITLAPEEAAAYNNANSQTTPQAKATALEAYLKAYPNSQIKVNVLETLMALYSQAPLNNIQKTLEEADSVLQLAPNTPQALLAEAVLRKSGAAAITDPTAQQAALDSAASYAQKGLVVTKPADMTDDAFKTFMGQAIPSFYSVIAYAALNKKDSPTAIDNYKKELASVPVVQTTQPGPYLQDTYYLSVAYLQSTPPDYLNCAYYGARFVAFAPEPYKSQITPNAKSCFKRYHGKEDGFDALQAIAEANLNPPADLSTKVTPAPTPAEIVANIVSTTPDLGTLAVSDKEYILQNGKPDDAAKVWDTIKGKSSQFPDVVVVEASPTVIKVSVSDNAVQDKVADFTFNMAAPEDIPQPKATPASKAAYKKAVQAAKDKADAIAALAVPGAKITITGTYDSYTPSPVMIVMKDGDVVLPKAAKPAAKPAAHPAAKGAARRPAARK